jgi:hypothetical protein
VLFGGSDQLRDGARAGALLVLAHDFIWGLLARTRS